jgi:hypothetical protein
MPEKTPSPKLKNHSPTPETLEQLEARLTLGNIARWIAQSSLKTSKKDKPVST